MININCFLGLHAFEHEGIQNITSLKDQLIAANHNQSEAILKRNADVIDRYSFNLIFILFLFFIVRSNIGYIY